MGVPRALDPTGVFLVDKPPGPSSFAMVARTRSKTGARTGHAGTLDPFASGLLILLSGRATREQDRFMRLDKRYVTCVDLSTRTTTGDPEGELLEQHDAPSRSDLESMVARLEGTVELPVPAASAVKIDGERAYRLHRRGVAVEMPVRRMQVHEAVLAGYANGIAELELEVGSGTYVRSIAEALGGHCTSLRRISIGPFRADEADPDRLLPLEEALARVDRAAVGTAVAEAEQ